MYMFFPAKNSRRASHNSLRRLAAVVSLRWKVKQVYRKNICRVIPFTKILRFVQKLSPSVDKRLGIPLPSVYFLVQLVYFVFCGFTLRGRRAIMGSVPVVYIIR